MKLKDNDPMYKRLLESGHAQELGKTNLGVYAVGLSEWMFQEKNKQALETSKIKDPIKLTTGPYDTQPTYLAIAPKSGGGGGGRGGGNKNFTIIPFDAELLKAAGGSGKSQKKPQSVKKALSNPKKPKNAANKRGKYFYIELHHKNKLDMTRRGPGQSGGLAPGETRHGKGKIKKTQGYWMKNLNKGLGEAGKVQLMQVAHLKSTGEEAPYRLRVPTSHFGVVMHPETGYKTLGPKKDKKNPALISAWKKILIEYGIPKHSPSKDTYFRFIIPKSERAESPYYQGLRARAGKKNNSR